MRDTFSFDNKIDEKQTHHRFQPRDIQIFAKIGVDIGQLKLLKGR